MYIRGLKIIHETTVTTFQSRFSVNVWCGVIGDRLIGPFVLEKNVRGDTYLKQTMLLGYIMLEVFYIYSLCYMLCFILYCYYYYYHHNALNHIKFKVPTPDTVAVPKLLVLYVR